MASGIRVPIAHGDKYGLLTIIAEAKRHRQPSGKTVRRVLCKCECGATTTVTLDHLRTGHVKSCGCFWRKFGFGHIGTTTYRIWAGMIQRCHNPRRPEYPQYGGRGIAVCQRWRDSFKAFHDDMGERPSTGHSLDRVDNDQGYYKDNCRWATRTQQARNARSNRFLTHQGDTLCIADWAERLEIAYDTLYYRIRSGWSVEDALTTPVGSKRT